jgi:RHS repeat-associated protein
VTAVRIRAVTGSAVLRRPRRHHRHPSSAGTLTYQTANTQGTALETINAAATKISRRYYDPYGNPAGAKPAWPSNHGYLGQPTDPNTTLDLLGARQYDPATGSFLTLDPLFEPGDPLAMGGYAYADDNSATNTDPTGLSEGGSPPNPCGTAASAACGTDNSGQNPTGSGTSPPVADPPGTPSSNGCGFLGLTCTAHFLTDALHGVTTTAAGLVTSFLQPFHDAQSCLAGNTTSCASTALFLLASPLYALKNTVTGTIETGQTIYHEFTTGHPGEAIGTITTLIAIAALAKKLIPTAAPEDISLRQAAQAARESLNVGARRNVAVTRFEIDGQSGQLTAVSGQASVQGLLKFRRRTRCSTPTAREIFRPYDAEYKILEELATQASSGSTGTVDLYSELPTFPACTSVIQQFQKAFPGISIHITTGA